MLRIVFLLMLALIFTSCSRTELMYRNADWMLERFAKRAVDIDDQQQEAWQPMLERALSLHRDQELPVIDAYLVLALQALDQSGGQQVDGECLVAGATLVYKRHVELAVDLAAPLLLRLEPGQIRYLADYLAERRSKIHARYLSGDKRQRQQARTRRVVKRIERWTGPLDVSQLARVDLATSEMPDIAEHWLAYRDQHTSRLLDLLEVGADGAALRNLLLSWWVPWEGQSSPFLIQWNLTREAFIGLVDDLAISLNGRQQERFAGRLADLRADLMGIRGGEPYPAAYNPDHLFCLAASA